MRLTVFLFEDNSISKFKICSCAVYESIVERDAFSRDVSQTIYDFTCEHMSDSRTISLMSRNY